MKRDAKCIYFLCAAVVCGAFWFLPLHADLMQGNYRNCAADELVGTWDMVDMHVDFAYGQSQAYFYPYQTFVFNKDGSFHLFSGTSPIDETQKRLLMQSTPASQTYTFDSNSSSIDVNVALAFPRQLQRQHYACIVLTGQDAAASKGNLLLISNVGTEHFGLNLKKRVN